MVQPRLFDMERRLETLSKFGDPLDSVVTRYLG
jgi:hypothetical protein